MRLLKEASKYYVEEIIKEYSKKLKYGIEKNIQKVVFIIC